MIAHVIATARSSRLYRPIAHFSASDLVSVNFAATSQSSLLLWKNNLFLKTGTSILPNSASAAITDRKYRIGNFTNVVDHVSDPVSNAH